MKIIELFTLKTARSKSTNDYFQGSIPFVTNSQVNNGVVAYVEPFNTDIVFQGPAICISGLGHATLHLGKFLPKGNGGDSCTVLTPLEKSTNIELLYYAGLFNVLHGWRFSFGRKTNKRRLEHLVLSPKFQVAPIDLDVEIRNNMALMSDLIKNIETEILNH